jgi:hypothetical protein
MPVTGHTPDSGFLDEEVAFWRRFIERWAREKADPVPSRAWEALAYAERKQESDGADPQENEVIPWYR